MIKIVLPELGEGIARAQLVQWHVQEGQSVLRDSDIVEMVTDKAVFLVPAPESGIINKIHYREGEEVPIGAVLADLGPL